MYIVKLTFNYDWPLFRQTPGDLGVWGNYKFVIDPNLKECDFWIVYSEYKLIKEECKCNKENIFFLPAECYNTSEKYPIKFLEQFGKIITVQKEIKGKNVIYHQNANPWFVEKSYDELTVLQPLEKTKLLSIISSDKVFTEGHRKRLEFAKRVKNYFGNSVDLFGRGLNSFEKKWDTLAPYKYHISIENDNCDDWVTEKFVDPILTFTYPFYYGCPNICKYMPQNSFTRIDINNYDETIETIENVIKNDSIYDTFIENSVRFRSILLNEQQLFPILCHFIAMHINTQKVKTEQTIYGLNTFLKKENIVKKIIRKIIE